MPFFLEFNMGKYNKYSFIRPEKSPVFYGYIVVLFGTVGVVSSIPGQTMGVSAFTESLQDALGLNSDRLSFMYLIGTLLSSFFLTRAGKWYDKYGARWIAFFATLGLAFSLLLCASSKVISDFLMSVLHFEHWLVPAVIMGFFFFLIRFSGQGVLTMVSRNMIMKWFDTKRGRVNAISSAVASITFALSPRWIFKMVEEQGWSRAWIILALILIGMSFVVLQFFRDKPEDHGLFQDGEKNTKEKTYGAEPLTARKQFTLNEAKKTRAFWMYSLMLAFNAFFVTGFTFYIISIFQEAGYTAEKGMSIFVPVSIISVSTTLIGNAISDWIKLKYILFVMIFGGILSSLGLVFLEKSIGYFFVLFGNGFMQGLFAVIISISWPRFFGRKYLGEISGKAMSMVVGASAVAPFLFSLSLTYLNTYAGIGILSLIFLVFIAVVSIKANNPQ